MKSYTISFLFVLCVSIMCFLAGVGFGVVYATGTHNREKAAFDTVLLATFLTENPEYKSLSIVEMSQGGKCLNGQVDNPEAFVRLRRKLSDQIGIQLVGEYIGGVGIKR